MSSIRFLVGLFSLFLCTTAAVAQPAKLIRSVKGGHWSEPTTWEGGTVPGAGSRVQIREGHAVRYDVKSDAVIRFIHIAGTLSFAPDKDTTLNVGLIKIQAGSDATEDGFDCDAHVESPKGAHTRPALLVGTPNRPIEGRYTAMIRLHYVAGHDKQSSPAIVCCGGGMDFHGAAMNRTWVKLGKPAQAGDDGVTLDEPVTGWKPGDRIIVVSTQLCPFEALRHLKDYSQTQTETEERIVKSIDGAKVTFDKPLAHDHMADRQYRGAVANLSRNVVVESALLSASGRWDGGAGRGHTMYHRGSTGSISFAEFRKLGREGILGRYSIHYHLCGDTMRGSSVIGASIWDSANRWITIHGTNYLVVRDCVGYKSLGHGYFLEDGTEVYNVLDRNLAVQAYTAKPLPTQPLPFDLNDGAGFWWANCLNSFTRNVAAECTQYGYFFQVNHPGDQFSSQFMVQQPDGSRKKVDIRKLPFVRFEDNEAHTQRRWGINLGSTPKLFDVSLNSSVGPDAQHPLVVRNLRVWNSVWSIGVSSRSMLMDGVDIYNYHYGFFHSVFRDHCYRGLKYEKTVNKGTAEGRLFQGGQGKRADEASYPRPLDPIDDQPPITVITHMIEQGDKLLVRGTTSDDGTVTSVLVNGIKAKATRLNFAEWEVVLDRPGIGVRITAHAEDAASNVEKHKHTLTWNALK